MLIKTPITVSIKTVKIINKSKTTDQWKNNKYFKFWSANLQKVLCLFSNTGNDFLIHYY